MMETGIFISDAEFNHLIAMRKRTKFNPGHAQVKKAVEEYLAKGGKITKLYAQNSSVDNSYFQNYWIEDE